MNTKLRGRDFINLGDYSRDDLETILSLAFALKIKLASGEPHTLLLGKSLGMLFTYASTRTRVSFETGMTQLGGHAQYYEPHQLQLGVESWEDTAGTLSRFLNGIVVRMVSGPQVREFKYGEARGVLNVLAQHSSVPVISACDDQGHPCQVMADVMTIIEKFGTDYRKKKVSLVWVCSKKGINPGVPHDLAAVAGALGMRLTVACPKGFEPDPKYIEHAKRCAAKSGGSIEIVDNIKEAVKDASVIYGRTWKAIGKTIDEDISMRKPYKDWRITQDHFNTAAPDAVFMNSMPVSRETDATPEVVDGPRSVIFDEAENRLHAQKAIMALLMG